MVAVVSGSGLGLFSSSASALGTGADGKSNVGRGRDQVFVNSTTGNLIVQSVDETLTALGLDFAAIRTYNSQGQFTDDNGDNWRMGVHQRLTGPTGTVNTNGSTITKTFGDGSEIIYTYSTARLRYESMAGDGANDYLTVSGGIWTWTDATSRNAETYDTSLRIASSRDADGNSVTYNYDGSSRLTSVVMAGTPAQTVFFDYTDSGAAANNLRAIRVVTAEGPQTLIRYYYDSSQRLRQVIVDLTPKVAGVPLTDANGDGLYEATNNESFITTYSYDGTSKRIASIAQSDGSSVGFTYQTLNGTERLRTATDAEGRVTTFTYTDGVSSGGTQATGTANTGVLSTTETANVPWNIQLNTLVRNEQQQTNVPYGLLTGQLTTPAGSGAWAGQQALDTASDFVGLESPQVAFDANGNGFAVWSRTDDNSYVTELVVSRYTRSTNSWSPPNQVTMYSFFANPDAVAIPASLAVDAATGNAIIAWTESELGLGTAFAKRYDAATGTWGVAANLGSTSGAPVAAINGAFAAISLVVRTGSRFDLFTTRWTGSAWSPNQAMEALTQNVLGFNMAIDNQGNINVLFGQNSNVYRNRYTASTNTWSGATSLATGSTLAPKFAFDANGNGFGTWVQGADVMFTRYTRSTNTWTTPASLDGQAGTVSMQSTAVDAAGNAIVAWTQVDGATVSAYAKRYTASTSTWSSVFTLESSSQAVSNLYGDITASVNGNYAAVAWSQLGASGTNSIYSTTFNGATMSSAALIGTGPNGASQPTIAVDALGNATTLFQRDFSWQLHFSRFTAGSGGGTPYYLVPASATWQSIANTLYGVNSAAAGTALQNAMPVGTSIAQGSQLLQTNLPPTLQVPTTITLPDYYLVPGTPTTPTWQSIAAVVYGVNNTAAGNALRDIMQAAYPTLSVGLHIQGLPATLPVPTTTTVPHYYVVQSTSWATTCQAIYNSQDPGLIQALQGWTGRTTIAVGDHLTVPLSLPYTVGGTGSGSTVYQTVTVDSPNEQVIYRNDTQGRLVRITRNTGVTTLDTVFTYDSVSGNVQTVTEDPAGLNRVTTYEYDPNTGVLLLSRDSLGNTAKRTYDPNNNQLLTETRYTVPDPDGAGGVQPSGALVTRFAYDGEAHLRFVISADGRVTEHQYNGAGQRVLTFNHLVATYTATPFAESDLSGWAAGAGAGARERIDYRYDPRGNIDRITRWATTDAAGVGTGPSSLTQFVYDQRGQLLQTIDPRGSGTAPNTTNPVNTQAYAHTFTYDGLGRLLTNTEWLAAAVGATPIKTRATTTSYQDLTRQTTLTLANGLISISTFNRAGELTRVDNGSLGFTTYAYDAAGRERIVTDPTLVRQFKFYDNADRLIGTVDGDGTLTELIYNKANQIIKTVRHSTLLTATRLASLVDASGNPTAVTFDTVRGEAGTADVTDQVTRRVYDNAGRLIYSIDEIGAVTKFTYDGANRVLEEVRYNNTISIARATDEVLPAGVAALVSTHADDRLTRHFYDNSDNRIATLDGAGYLSEFTYSNAGRLITAFERANPTASGLRAAGTLAQLQASAGTDTEIVTDTEVDITTQYYYDMQGRLAFQLDGEGYATKTNYDVAGNATSTVRYDRRLTYSSRPLQATIESDLIGALSHTTSRDFDGAGRLIREVNYESTATEYELDNMDNLLSVRRAAGDATDERWTSARYDGLGRVIRELTGEGRVALAGLGASPTQTAIDQVWDRFGVLYTYDTGGRRTTATERPNDLQTNVTRYYYDNDGRLRFEVNHLGERKEYRYNALGQLTDELKSYNRISTSGLAGGLLTDTLITTLTASPDSARDAKTTHTYTLRGERNTSLTLEGANVTRLYNAFGELRSEQRGTGFAATTYTYTTRGQLYQTFRNSVLFETRDYDAFGRLWKVTDGRGKITKAEYDRLGRVLVNVDALGGRNSIVYDGYSRTTRTDDATSGLNETVYNYDDVNRTTTIDTPEGVRIVTTHNRHDQTTKVTIAATATPTVIVNEKSYSYDKNGNLRYSYEGGVQIEERTWDRGNRMETVVNARGITTRFVYDAANRVLTQTVDSITGGLQLVTQYVYDGEGRVFEVTDPRGTLTRSTYDRDGRITDVAIDPSGLNLRTHYDYDTRNNTTLITEGYGTLLPRRTQYVFDNLGRRTEEIIDPSSIPGGTLNLRTQYKYDNSDNMTREIDTRGFSCWYVYDDKNRLTHKIDALGGLTYTTYDAMDRVSSTRRYVTAINSAEVAALEAIPSPTTANFTMPATASNDRLIRSYFDKDGREKYSIDGVGTVTQRTYDAAGNITRLRVISATQLTGTYADLAAVEGALGATITNNPAAADRVTWNAYDARGRLEFSIDSINGTVGAVQRYTYDGNGNVIETRDYATSRGVTLATDVATLRSWATTNASTLYDQVTRFWYDNADRARFVLDGEGYLTETRYNDSTRVTTNVAYNRLQTGVSALAASSTPANVTGAILTDTNNPSRDQFSHSWVDPAGRTRFKLDAEGYLAETRYDDQTGAMATTAYAVKPNGSPGAATPLATLAGNVVATSTQDRTTMNWVDAAGRTRFAINAERYAVETRYDDLTGTRRVITYAAQIVPGSMPTIATQLSSVGSTVTALADGNQQTTKTDLDKVGRVNRLTKADGSVDQTIEYYEYNATGDKTKFTNAKASTSGQASYTWDYAYDGNGNLLTETSPLVDVYTATTTATAFNDPVVSNQRVVTKFVYDFLGNVSSRYEGFGSSQERLTRYEYDALGNQVRTFYPAVFLYNAAGDTAPWGIGGTLTRTDTPIAQVLSSEVWYDALGNAFRNRDVSGNFSYKTYDRLGRAQYEIGPRVEGNAETWNKNFVSLTEYDAFGNEKRVTRYATGLATQPSTSAATLRAADFTIVTSSDDRAIDMAYDRRNLKTGTTLANLSNNFIRQANTAQGAAFTAAGATVNQYNAFGEVVLSRQLLSVSPDYADTYSYYDRRGLKTADIDPGKYLTKYTYDETGDLKSQTEFARAITGSIDTVSYADAPETPWSLGVGAVGTERGFDRRVEFGYDRLNRKTSQKEIRTEHATLDPTTGALTTAFADVETLFAYDVLGNQICVTDAAGNKTYTYYDVLGRTIAIVEPTRNLGDGTRPLNTDISLTGGTAHTPATVFMYDINGNMLRQVQYATSVTVPANYALPTFTSNANDRITSMQYDLHGHVTRTEDPTGADRFASYAANGKVAKEWQIVTNAEIGGSDSLVTIHKYDASGNEVETLSPMTHIGSTLIRTARSVFNAFGELATRGSVDTLNASGNQEYFDYDAAGRVWRTNSGDGVSKVFLYDAAGRVTVELRAQSIDVKTGALAVGGSVTMNTLQDVLNRLAANVAADGFMRTETVYDAKGNVLERYTPSYTITSGTLPQAVNDLQIGIVAGSPVANQVYLNWAGQNFDSVEETFLYRIQGQTTWSSRTIDTLPNGRLGVNVHDLRGQVYDFLVTYKSPYQTSSFAESIGTFRVDVPINTGLTGISRDNLNDYDTVGNVTIAVPPTGTVSGTIVSTETYSSPPGGSAPGGNPPRWWGGNAVLVNWSSTGGQSVRVEVDYDLMFQSGTRGPPGVTQWTVTTAATQIGVSWPHDGTDQSTWGGISVVTRVRIYSVDASGNKLALLRDSNPALAPKGVVWAAPVDTGVTAVFRYKPVGQSSYTAPDVAATRVDNNQFSVNVFNLLTTAGTYDYQIEYWRAGVRTALKDGRITSNGGTISASGTLTPSTPPPFDEPVGRTNSTTIVDMTMQWLPPSQAVDVTFEYGTTTAYGQSFTVTQGSPWWSVALNSLAPPLGGQGVGYSYRITYKQGGRIVSRETGTFSVYPPTNTTSWSASVTPDNEPGAPEAVSTVTGTSSVLNATGTVVSTETYSSPPGGSAPGGNPPRWWGGNAVLVNWISTAGQTVRVMVDYDMMFQSGSRGPAGPTRSAVTTAASQFGVSWPHDGTDQSTWGGVWGVTRVRIYSVDGSGNNLALLRDSQSPATVPGPVGMTWTAPSDAQLTYKFFYNVSGSGSPIERTITRNGNALSVDLASLGTGTYDYRIAYYKPGESTEIVNKTGTFTTNGGTVITVNTQNNASFAPSWTTVNPTGSSVLWNRAIQPTDTMAFEYWNGVSWVAKSYTTDNNTTFVSDFTNFGVGSYTFRLRHRNAAGVLLAQWNGSIGVGTSIYSTPAAALVTSAPTDFQDATDIIPVSATMTDRVFRWSFAKLDATNDQVRFTYTINGTTHTVTPSGNGPNFAVDLVQLPVNATTNFTWTIQYTRPQLGESDPYAKASGSGSVTVNTVAPTLITVDTQTNQWPSLQQIAQPTDAGNGFLGWTTDPEAGAIITLKYQLLPGGTETTLTTGFVANTPTGRKIDLSALGAGSYRYTIEYRRPAQATAYARATGQVTINKTEGAPTVTAARGADRPESVVGLLGAYISPREITYPPEAVWVRLDLTTPPTFIPGIQDITPQQRGGGFIQDAPPSTVFPKGQYHQADPATYRHFSAMVFYWTANASLDTQITFGYRVRGSTGAYTPIGAYRLVGFTQVGADITSLAVGDYEFEIKYTRTGAPAPYGTVNGFFNRSADIMAQTVSVTPSAGAQSTPANPVLKQSVDRWGNTLAVEDAARNLTEYRFDQRNQQVQVTAPVVSYLDTRTTFTDVTPSARPTTYTYYDKLGRKVATTDANGNTMRYYHNAAAQVLTTQNADSSSYTGGAFLRNIYNGFGELVQVADELTQTHDRLGFKTRNFYDKAGRLTAVWREISANTMPAMGTVTAPASLQTMSYGYDEAGRRIREVNGAGEVTRYAYDLAGNVRLRRTPGANDTRYTYDVHNNKNSEEVDLYNTTFARQTWTTDYFGRVRGHVGLTLNNGGATPSIYGYATDASFTYDYNMAGMLRRQWNSTQNIDYDFDAAGQVKVIRDTAVNRQTYYTYDSAGRRVREKVVVEGLVHQDTTTSYDALGRISFVEDPDYRLNYSYDLAGNRTLIRDEFVNHAATRTVENLYFTYDAMNRVKIGQGVLTGTATARGVDVSGNFGSDQGYIYTYNARGDRVSNLMKGTIWSWNGSVWSLLRTADGRTSEKYTYDGLGRMTDVERQTNTGTNWTLYRHNVFDKANRITDETNYSLETNGTILSRWTNTQYDAEGRPLTQTTRKGASNELENIVRFGVATPGTTDLTWTRGYDKSGTLRGYDVEYYDSGHQTVGTPTFTNRYRQSYYLGDSFMVKHEQARARKPNGDNGPIQDGDVERSYANGELVKAVDAMTANKSRAWVNNQNGQVLTSVQTTIGTQQQLNSAINGAVAHASANGSFNAVKAQYYFHFNGVTLGSFGQLQPSTTGQFRGNFDTNYTPVTAEYPMTVPPMVTAMKGDTLRIIAARVYGDANLWYILADENGLGLPDEVIPEGTSIRVPNNVVSLANSAGVYKPYDASKAIGDLTPSQPVPPPPKPDSCGMFKMFLMMVVMLVVTIITFGAAATVIAPMMGAMFASATTAAFATFVAASAVAAAAGSIASQGVGILTGMQDKINWKEVGMSALAAGVTAGLGGLGEMVGAGVKFGKVLTTIGKFANAIGPIGRAAVGNALTQGLGVATGMQSSFNWRQVAAAAAAQTAAMGAGRLVGSVVGNGKLGGFVTGMASRFAGNVASARVMGGKINYSAIAVDAFSNSVANLVVGSMMEGLRDPATRGAGSAPASDGSVGGMAIAGNSAKSSGKTPSVAIEMIEGELIDDPDAPTTPSTPMRGSDIPDFVNLQRTFRWQSRKDGEFAQPLAVTEIPGGKRFYYLDGHVDVAVDSKGQFGGGIFAEGKLPTNVPLTGGAFEGLEGRLDLMSSAGERTDEQLLISDFLGRVATNISKRDMPTVEAVYKSEGDALVKNVYNESAERHVRALLAIKDPDNAILKVPDLGKTLLDFERVSLIGAASIGVGSLVGGLTARYGIWASGVSAGIAADATVQALDNASWWATDGAYGRHGIDFIELGAAGALGLAPGVGRVLGKWMDSVADAWGSLKGSIRARVSGRASTSEVLADDAVNTAAVPKGPIRRLEVVTYEESVAREIPGDKLTGDHLPSIAAIKKNVERTLGRRLSAEEYKILRDKTNVVVIDEDFHEAGRTFFGKNKPAQIQTDSQDLYGASLRDQEVHLQNAERFGYNRADLRKSFDTLNQRNRVLFDSLSTKQGVEDFFTRYKAN